VNCLGTKDPVFERVTTRRPSDNPTTQAADCQATHLCSSACTAQTHYTSVQRSFPGWSSASQRPMQYLLREWFINFLIRIAAISWTETETHYKMSNKV